MNIPAALLYPLPTAALHEAARNYCRLKGLNPDESIIEGGPCGCDVALYTPRYLSVAEQLRELQLQLAALCSVSLTSIPSPSFQVTNPSNELKIDPVQINNNAFPIVSAPPVMNIVGGSTTELRFDQATGNVGLGSVGGNRG